MELELFIFVGGDTVEDFAEGVGGFAGFDDLDSDVVEEIGVFHQTD